MLSRKHGIRSIRFRVIALMVVPILVLFALVVWNTQRVFNEFMLESTRSAINNYSQTLNLALSIQLGSPDTAAGLEPFLQELIGAETGGIIYLTVLDEHGQTLARTRQSPEPLPPASENLTEALDQALAHVQRPILLGNASVGSLHFGVSLTALRETARSLFMKNVLEGLGVLGAILAVLLALGTVVMVGLGRRLSHLMNVSQAIAGGQYDLTITDHGQDEFTVLSNQLNLMASALRSRIHTLESREAQIQALNTELVSAMEELKSTQASLVRSEKLAGLGAIVAAVAHELNTPIGNAVGVASSLATKTRDFHVAATQGLRKSTLDAYLDDSNNACDILMRNLENAAELIASFKHVAVDQTSSRQRPFVLADTLEDVLVTLRPTVKRRPIEVVTELQDGIHMDSFPGPLGQVIANLFNNAVTHAFDATQPGRITIRAHTQGDDRVVIEFSDDGKGIAPAHLHRLFDPFFTTRLGKGGSGLGLNIAYNIVTGVLQGEINVRSILDTGTTFTLSLPRQIAPADANAP